MVFGEPGQYDGDGGSKLKKTSPDTKTNNASAQELKDSTAKTEEKDKIEQTGVEIEQNIASAQELKDSTAKTEEKDKIEQTGVEIEQNIEEHGTSVFRINPEERPWESTGRADAKYSSEFWEKTSNEVADKLATNILSNIELDAGCNEILNNDPERKAELEFLIKNLSKKETYNLFSDVLKQDMDTESLTGLLTGETNIIGDLYEGVEKDILIRERLMSKGIKDALNEAGSADYFLEGTKMKDAVDNEVGGFFDEDKPERLQNLPYYNGLVLQGRLLGNYSKIEPGVNSGEIGKTFTTMTDIAENNYDLINGTRKKGERSEKDMSDWLITQSKIRAQFEHTVGRSSSSTNYDAGVNNFLLKTTENNFVYQDTPNV